jgi:hypothetical protein
MGHINLLMDEIRFKNGLKFFNSCIIVIKMTKIIEIWSYNYKILSKLVANDYNLHGVASRVITFWLISTSYCFKNYLDYLLATINSPCLGLMNSKETDCNKLLRMGCTMLVDKGWLACFIFHRKETISSLSFGCSLILCMFYLGFFFVVSCFITWM